MNSLVDAAIEVEWDELRLADLNLRYSPDWIDLNDKQKEAIRLLLDLKKRFRGYEMTER